MILEVIDQCIRSLFRMGILIRQAGPQDRFKRAMQHTELAFPASFDINYVEQKHIKLRQPSMKWLAQRLGTAIAKRRQFIKYCRDHKSRLSMDDLQMSDEADTRTENLSSEATIFVKEKFLQASSLQPSLEESDDAPSPVTAPTAFGPNELQSLPLLEDLSPEGQPFECPICFTMQVFADGKAWK